MAPTIAVIGSLNVDFITRTPRMPAAGETLTANSFDTGFGGKGANQCVACARLSEKGAKVCMVGNVGDDSFGQDYVEALTKEGIDTSLVTKVAGQKTGIANIIVDEDTGENRILLATNANHAFSSSIDDTWSLVPEHVGFVVFQLEIPIQVVLHNIHKARQMGKHVVLNPAPALPLPESVYSSIDTLILNETEAHLLSDGFSARHEDIDLSQLSARFIQLGVRDSVIITLGARGVLYSTSNGISGTVPAEKVAVVDTTAAGDTFLGAYTAFRANQGSNHQYIEDALRYATSAAARTVERKGAMTAIPYRRELT